MAGLRGVQRVFNNVNRKIYLRMIKLMHEAAMETMQEAYKLRGFKDVTKNLINSFAVGGYYQGDLLFMVTASDMGIDPPRRSSLKYKQKAKIVGTDKWFVADDPKSKGGQNARSLARQILQSTHPPKRMTYALVIIAPMEYAEWVEKKKKHDVLSGVHNEMPAIVQRYIYIE